MGRSASGPEQFVEASEGEVAYDNLHHPTAYTLGTEELLDGPFKPGVPLKGQLVHN